jgi:hypothetical protein
MNLNEMTHTGLAVLPDLIVVFAALFLAIIAHYTYRKLRGRLAILWRPFEIIMIGIIPLAYWHSMNIVEWYFDMQVIGQPFRDIIEHSIIAFLFVMIGIAFLVANKRFAKFAKK